MPADDRPLGSLSGGYRRPQVPTPVTAMSCKRVHRVERMLARRRPGVKGPPSGRNGAGLNRDEIQRWAAIASRIPPRISVPDASSRAVTGSPNTTQAARAVTTGTDSCTSAARNRDNEGKARYQSV